MKPFTLMMTPMTEDEAARSSRDRTESKTSASAGLLCHLDVVSLGESAMADEGCGYADEGKKVFRLAFV
ncbi:hypothetical protein, partial [Streptomyces lydicus]|uniref:hypothetical protein n=1 Tax=Streptomyces lydicus TaxID=47763 RepID=UPI00378C69AC